MSTSNVICSSSACRSTNRRSLALPSRLKSKWWLPPYSPDGNKIERLWLDLHANVTRNHRCQSMAELMDNVYSYLRNRNRRLERIVNKAA